MKILGINGSPRPGGNTEWVVLQVLQEAERCGAETEYIHLEKLNFHGCKGCLWCQKNGQGKCVQQDDALPLYDKIAKADIVLFASPVYFSTMTSQLKTLMDRLYPFYGRGGTPSRLPKPVKAVLIVTQGQPDPKLYKTSFEIAAAAFRLIGFDVAENPVVFPCIPDKGDVMKKPQLLEQAKCLGTFLCS